MPELERYMLHLLAELDAKLRTAVEDFDYNSYPRAHRFLPTTTCRRSISISARTSSIARSIPRPAPRPTSAAPIDRARHAVPRAGAVAAPVLVFTTEEVWGTRYPDGGAVHLLEWPEMPAGPTTAVAQVGQRCASSARRSPRRSSHCGAKRSLVRVSRPSHVPVSTSNDAELFENLD